MSKRVQDSAHPRAPVGIREVLAFPLHGRTSLTEVRAILVGSRIDTRDFAGSVELEEIRAEETGVAFVFRYGAVVLLGASPEAAQDFLARLGGRVADPVAEPETETATIELQPRGDEQVGPDGRIVLRELTPERLLLVATVVARSVVMERDEDRIADALVSIEPLVSGLQLRGRAVIPLRRVMQQIGVVLAAHHRITGRAQIAEKPEVLWEHPELDLLYGRLESEFELGDRARTVERKLGVLGNTASTLLDLVIERRSVRLELAIIALIAFEILLTLRQQFF